MPTQYYNIHGRAKWAKLVKPDSKYNVWSINLYLDDANLNTYKKSGIQGLVKEDADGKYVVLRRPVAKLIKGELVKYDPPKIEIRKDDDYVPFEGHIGNNSVVTANVAVYDTVKGKGHTLLGVTVRELVEYAPQPS